MSCCQLSRIVNTIIAVNIVMILSSCKTAQIVQQSQLINETGIAVAHLADNDMDGLRNIQKTFAAKNPGYSIHYLTNVKEIKANKENRITFIQNGGGSATLSDSQRSKFSVGDIILLEKGIELSSDSMFNALIFSVPHEIPSVLPSFIRPDWDENITDTPGGCATETNAYRRILLTWNDKIGPYIFHSINAHRVRIMNSFSHYHPKNGGFDEFYLVQMARPKARIITSNKVDLIEKPDLVTKKQSKNLLQSTALREGDLVYLPRGIMHRGIDSILAQVITIPGFIPGAEIGVDHHLKRINDRLNFVGLNKLEFNKGASSSAIIK